MKGWEKASDPTLVPVGHGGRHEKSQSIGTTERGVEAVRHPKLNREKSFFVNTQILSSPSSKAFFCKKQNFQLEGRKVSHQAKNQESGSQIANPISEEAPSPQPKPINVSLYHRRKRQQQASQHYFTSWHQGKNPDFNTIGISTLKLNPNTARFGSHTKDANCQSSEQDLQLS